MNKDEALAREINLKSSDSLELERAVVAAIQAEREACALVLDTLAEKMEARERLLAHTQGWPAQLERRSATIAAVAHRGVAAAIRARGEAE